MLEIYMYDMRSLSDRDEYDRMFGRASSYRRKKALEGRAKENIAAAAVLDMALERHGLNESETELVYGEYGKPYMKDGRFFFNISHSGDYAVCALSDTEVGVDIQKKEKLKLKVARRFFADSEYECIVSRDDEAGRIDVFYRLWALKESFVKAVGTGISIPFNSFEIVLGENVKVIQNDFEGEFEFVEKNIEGYSMAVCRKLSGTPGRYYYGGIQKVN